MTDKVTVSDLCLLFLSSSFLTNEAIGDSSETLDLIRIYFLCACNFCSVSRPIIKCHLGNPESVIISPFQCLFLSILHNYWFSSQLSCPVINYINCRGACELYKEFLLVLGFAIFSSHVQFLLCRDLCRQSAPIRTTDQAVVKILLILYQDRPHKFGSLFYVAFLWLTPDVCRYCAACLRNPQPRR